jgi:PAS domain-containing protein
MLSKCPDYSATFCLPLYQPASHQTDPENRGPKSCEHHQGRSLITLIEHLKLHAQKWRASVGTGKPFKNEVRDGRAEDGQYRWFVARAVPLRDEKGNIAKWYGVST